MDPQLFQCKSIDHLISDSENPDKRLKKTLGWLSLTMVALILCGSLFTVTAYADDIRITRLRQHGLDVPDDPDLGHPSH